MAANTMQLEITGMHCGSCEGKIHKALLDVPGVSRAEVSHQSGHAVVQAEADVDAGALLSAVHGAGKYQASVAASPPASSAAAPEHDGAESAAGESLYPLFLIVGYITGASLLIAYVTGDGTVESIMRYFMSGFFIVFSFFKLLDLPGFVSAYRGYDLLARKVPAWGWAYPFVELGLGIAYLLNVMPGTTNAITLVVMLLGAAGVLKALLDKKAIRCACLGAALNLPMTKVTLVEDLVMAAMAGGMLVLMA